MVRERVAYAAGLAFAAVAVCAGPATAGTLADVKARGSLSCGINPNLAGFSVEGDDGSWSGFDIDYCRAIAAAVLGDADAVTFLPLTARERFDELRSGKVDVLVRDTAWTMARDTSYGLSFAAVNYFNGVGFMVPASLGINSALQLNGASICVESGSLAEVAVSDYFARQGMTFTAVPVPDDDGMQAAYDERRCDAATGDLVELYAARLKLADPAANAVLPESLSKDPYGLVVRQGDEQWFAIVRWVHFALINAEELGVTAANAADMRGSPDEAVRALLGADGNYGADIGLPSDWAFAAISAVGNYGEIFDRNLGAGSPLQVARGLNRLWTDGGLHFAPAIR